MIAEKFYSGDLLPPNFKIRGPIGHWGQLQPALALGKSGQRVLHSSPRFTRGRARAALLKDGCAAGWNPTINGRD